MKNDVYVIQDAEDDLLDIYKYIAVNDSIKNAERLLSELEDTCHKLKTFPEREHIPPELERVGVSNYREIHNKPYRIIYQVIEKNVYVLLIVDGRRDMESLLQRRLLGA